MDWFRKKSWSKEDELDFFQRLGRARKDGRAQYLKIQGIVLLETGDPKLLDVAATLLQKVLDEYPDDLFNKASVLDTLGDIEKRREDWAKAISFYEQALQVEQVFPQVKTQAYLNFSEIVVKTKSVAHYDRVKELIRARADAFLFPVEKYKAYSILAVISYFEGNEAHAKEYALLADENGSATTSGLNYHKHLGLVEKRDSLLDRLVRRSS
ncbi:MAG: tetratricopeptide repeat protein [Flavobacteriales bacterium]|nr:tetratricopeptide repeat protein [Flavobacteriales bacterium]